MTGSQPEGKDWTERWYRVLLLGYPAPYRERHGGELIGTLLEAYPSRRLPSLRESAGLLDAGLVARLRSRLDSFPAWAAGLQLGVLLLALMQAGSRLGNALTIQQAELAIVLPLLLIVVPLLLGRMGTAAVMASIQAALATYEAHLGVGTLSMTRVEIVSSRTVEVQESFWMAPGVLEAWVIAVGAVALAVTRRTRGPLPRRSWWWLTVPLVQAAFTAWASRPLADYGWDHQHLPASLTALLVLPIIAVVGFLLFALRATVAIGDPRWTIAAGVYLVPTGILAAALATTKPSAVLTLDNMLPAVLLAAACTVVLLGRTPPRAVS